MAQNIQDDRSTSSHSTGFVRPYYNCSHRHKPNGHSSAHQYNQPNIMHHLNYRKQSNYNQVRLNIFTKIGAISTITYRCFYATLSYYVSFYEAI
jgi:hypothetical protein